MSFRIGKKNFAKAKSTAKKIKLSQDIPLLKIDGEYRVICECGWSRHVSKMEIDLLSRNQSPRFKCSGCLCKHYNIVDINNLISEYVESKSRKEIRQEIVEEILKSNLTVHRVMNDYKLSYQVVMKIFKENKK